MKTSMRTLILLFSVLTAGQAQASPVNLPTPINFEKFYIPQGFDDNDNVQVIAEGTIPNNCYRLGEPSFTINRKNHIIRVQLHVYEVQDICVPVPVAYFQVINLGRLAKGNYHVMNSDGTHAGSVLSIVAAKLDIVDNYLYAPVQQAFAESNGRDGKLTMVGSFTNSCLTMKEVKLDMQKNVLVVLPIAYFSTGETCHTGHFPFRKEVALDATMHGHFLLHVRTSSGNAVNSIVDVE